MQPGASAQEPIPAGTSGVAVDWLLSTATPNDNERGTAMAWDGSTRRDTLPTNWATLRRRILDRDRHTCQWPVDAGICGAPANQVDHLGDREDHRSEALRALCAWHHNRRSSAQGNEQRWAIRTTRPPERHPGLS